MIRERMNFENRDALATSLARKVGHILSKTVSIKGYARLAVSGGTTPVLFFEHLSRVNLSWDKVTVTLVDERLVTEDNPRSNARLVRQHLLQNAAKAARFVPLDGNPEAAKLSPFCAVVLGMGTDGHTASYFPGGDTLDKALDPATSQPLIEISAPAAGEPRITFTLPHLLSAHYLALHIEGREKLAVLEKAEAGTNIMEMPIRAILASQHSLDIYWCP
jgi:6-phosphogluconolactonase